jgi:peptide subunit release factor 1 (eRF1)
VGNSRGGETVLPIEQDIMDVERFDTGGAPALSLYLDTDASREAGRNLKAQLDHALREAAQAASEPGAAEQIAAASEIALEHIRSVEPTPRAVAAFVCAERQFVRVIPLPDPTDRSAYWGTELRIKPLLAMLDEHERTTLALVDQEHARVFRAFLGQIEEVVDMEWDEPGEAQAGRAQRKSQGRAGVAAYMAYGERNIQRRHDWHVRRHLQRVLDAIRDDGDRLLFAGTQETVYELWRLLPRRLRNRTTVIRGLALHASLQEVLDQVLIAQRSLEREDEEELVDNLFGRDGARSVFGGAAVLEAISDDRVHTLVYTEDVRLAGAECSACGWLLEGSAPGSCPRCGQPLVLQPDLVERLVWRAIKAGGRVEEVRPPASNRLRERGDGLAALLRYIPKAFSTT